MTSEQIKIIESILNDSHVSSSQRSKILSLAAKEMGGDLNQIKGKINMLESRVYGANSSVGQTAWRLDESDTSGMPDKLTIYNDPKETYRFLVNFNQDPVLRHTCHEVGSEELRNINAIIKKERYCYASHKKEIDQAWTKLKKQGAPKRLKAMIEAYLMGNAPWSHDSIETSWESSAVKRWCDENQGVPPNLNEHLLVKKETKALEIEKPFQWGGNPVMYFTGLVLNFKNRLHIRNESSLSALLKIWNDKLKEEENIEVKLIDGFGGGIEIFTHVDQLLNGYKALLKMYKTIWKKNSPDTKMPAIEVSVEENKDMVFLSIKQKTTYSKAINSTVSRPRGTDYTGIINSNLNGTCDLRVRALFPCGKKYAVEIWTSESNCKNNPDCAPHERLKDDSNAEVTHILEFPKR